MAGEPLLVGQAELAVGRAHGEDDGVRPVGGALGVGDRLDLALEVDRLDVVGDDLGAEPLGLGAHVLHELGAHDAVAEAGEVLDLGGVHQRATGGDGALEEQRLEVGAGGVDGGGVAGRAGADDDQTADVGRCGGGHAATAPCGRKAVTPQHTVSMASTDRRAWMFHGAGATPGPARRLSRAGPDRPAPGRSCAVQSGGTTHTTWPVSLSTTAMTAGWPSYVARSPRTGLPVLDAERRAGSRAGRRRWWPARRRTARRCPWRRRRRRPRAAPAPRARRRCMPCRSPAGGPHRHAGRRGSRGCAVVTGSDSEGRGPVSGPALPAAAESPAESSPAELAERRGHRVAAPSEQGGHAHADDGHRRGRDGDPGPHRPRGAAGRRPDRPARADCSLGDGGVDPVDEVGGHGTRVGQAAEQAADAGRVELVVGTARAGRVGCSPRLPPGGTGRMRDGPLPVRTRQERHGYDVTAAPLVPAAARPWPPGPRLHRDFTVPSATSSTARRPRPPTARACRRARGPAAGPPGSRSSASRTSRRVSTEAWSSRRSARPSSGSSLVGRSRRRRSRQALTTMRCSQVVTAASPR